MPDVEKPMKPEPPTPPSVARQSLADALRADPDYQRQCRNFAYAIAKQPTPESRRAIWQGLRATIAEAYRAETNFSVGQVAVLLATWDAGDCR